MKLLNVKFNDQQLTELINFASSDLRNKKLNVKQVINKIEVILYNSNKKLSKNHKELLKVTLETIV